jgi:hypothetical protein
MDVLVSARAAMWPAVPSGYVRSATAASSDDGSGGLDAVALKLRAVHVASPEPRLAFVPSRDALAGEAGGMLVVLDLRTESFSILDPVATTMWNLLVELGDRDRVLERLRAIYDAGEMRLARDLDGFTATMIGGGFASWSARVVAGAPHPAMRRRRVRGMLAVRAWWRLARTVLRLRREGFAATYRASCALAGATAPVDTTDAPHAAALLARGLRAFARAESVFVIRKAPRDCFPRSIALFCFLRELGVPVEHRIGVTRFPFRAHAWVEFRGSALAEPAREGGLFSPIARLA